MPETPSTPPPAAPRAAALRITLAYAGVSALWILFSDTVLQSALGDSGQIALLSALKGWLFTAVTAVLLYRLLLRWPAVGPTASGVGNMPPAAAPRGRKGLPLAVLLTIVGLTAAGIAYNVDHLRRTEHTRLEAVVELKSQQLLTWLNERNIDASLVATGADAATLVHQWRVQGDERSRDLLLARITRLRPLSHFDGFTLLDERGALLWSSLAPEAAPDAAARAALGAVARQRQAQSRGPYLDAQGRTFTDVAVPLAGPGAVAGAPVPLLVGHLGEAVCLPPRLNHWPVPSATGEVVLVRRDGGQVVFLSTLRAAPGAPPHLRLPASQAGLLAAQLVAADGPGMQLLSGRDYAGRPSFGVGRRLPGTNLYLLAKMDESELYRAAAQEALWIVLAGLLGLFIVTSAVVLARQREQLAMSSREQQALREKLRALGLLAAIAESSEDAIFAKDRDGCYTLFNAAAGRAVGQSPADVIGRDDRALFPPEQAQLLMDTGARALAEDRVITLEEKLSTPQGERVFLATKGPLRDNTGAVIGVFGLSRDITHLRQAEHALARANRALLASRECGQACMRALREDELLREVCRIVVERGGYRMAWVGYTEDDTARTVRPMARWGVDDGYLDSVRVSWDADDEHGRGPTGRAIRERRPLFTRNIATEPDYTPWRAAALARGYASSISLPLLPDDVQCLGALTLYAAEPEAFDDEEVRLLTELANDVAFGVRALHDRAARLEVEQLLRQQKERLVESQRIARVGSWEVAWPAKTLTWSDETYRMHGVVPATFEPSIEAVNGLVDSADRPALRRWMTRIVAGEDAADLDIRVTHPDGETHTLSVRGHLVREVAGQPIRVVGTLQDVTALRRAEHERLVQEARYRELFASNPHPMWVYDVQTLAFVEVNDAAVAKYGYTRDEFRAMRLTDIRPEGDVPALLQHLRSVGMGRPQAEVWRHRRKDGGVMPVEVTAHTLGFAGRPSVVVLAQDVTAQKAAEESLALQARRAEALLQLPEWAETLDELSFLQRAQEAAEQLTGSRIAFIHFVNADGETIELVAWSKRTLAEFCNAACDKHYPISQAGVWADAFRQRKPVVFNDYADYPHERGLPEGHAALDRLVSVPVIDNGRVVMLAGVGGKAVDYEPIDVETLQLISNDTWRLLQRRRADAALVESEASYRALTEQVPAIIYRARLDAHSTTTYISPAIATLGWTSEEWLARPALWLESMHADDRDRVLAAVAASHDDGGNVDVEYRLRTRGGAWRHIHDRAAVVRDSAGQPLSLQGVMVDVSARVQAEAELRKLSQAVEQSPNSIVITNVRAQIEYVNEAFLDVTGYTRDEVMGRNPRILQGENVDHDTYTGMWAALTAGRAWRGSFRNRRKDGSEYAEFAHVAPLRQPDGRVTHYVAVKEDITEKMRIAEELDRHRQRLEELVHERTSELAEARHRAEAANRAKSAFLANMSHEIRTPMNAIVGLSFLLQRDQATPQQAARLEKIDAAALHLLSIINSILDLSKIEAGKLMLDETDFELGAVLGRVHALIADRALAKGVAVRIEPGRLPCWLHGDVTRLSQALSNYADNALKFTARGSIVLRVRVLEEGDDALLLRFEVQDTGIGIAAAELPRLFQTFEQADASTTRRYGGTGLGLALTRRLAELMGGTTGVESRPDVGSSFWLTARLRRALAPPKASLPDAATTDAELRRRCRGVRVLLAEDDAVNREVAIELLHAAGVVVDTAVDGSQAVQHALAQPYDLVLMDVQMPVMDGFEATRVLRAEPRLAGLPILALTANAFEEDRQACIAAGMDDFVAKPVDPKLLYATMLRWLPQRALPEASAESLHGPADAGAHRLTTTEREFVLSALAAVDGLNVERGLQALGGDLYTYLRLLHSLVHGHRDDVARLQQHLSAGELEPARALAHRLKGAAGALGAQRVQTAAAALDDALRQQGSAAALPALCNSLRVDSDELFAALSDLPRLPAAGDEALPDVVQASAVLAELETLIACDDTAAGELFETHRVLLLATLGPVAATLGQQLETFDYPAALLTLRAVLAVAPPAPA